MPEESAAVLQILILADDLTGALEAGAHCAAFGLASRVFPNPSLCPHWADASLEAAVVNTETRHAGAGEAGRRVEAWARRARRRGVRLLVKKTDSTLRGNIATELAAVVRVYPEQPLFFIPAYPELGRAVRRGLLYVDGRPVSETAFARDPLNPILSSSIPDMLRAGQTGPVHETGSSARLAGSGPGIWVVDGETEDEVGREARLLVDAGMRALAGPAGLVRHLLECLHPSPSAVPSPPAAGTCVVVSGSLHEASKRQVVEALSRGWRSGGVREIERSLEAERWMILDPDPAPPLRPLEHAAGTGKVVVELLRRASPDCLVVFGGDTAFAILRELRFPVLEPMGEVMRGLPVSRILAGDLQAGLGQRERDLLVVTKAGGFGAPDLLLTVRDLLGRDR